MQYLRNHPEEYERLLQIREKVRLQGFKPIPINRLKQFFDYERR